VNVSSDKKTSPHRGHREPSSDVALTQCNSYYSYFQNFIILSLNQPLKSAPIRRQTRVQIITSDRVVNLQTIHSLRVMLPPTIPKESVVKVLSAKKAHSGGTTNCAIMEQEGSPASTTNTNKHQQEAGYASHRSRFKSHFAKQQSEKSFRSLNSSGSGGSSGPGLLSGNRSNIPTSNIVNRALEVMSNSLKDSDYSPRQPVKTMDDGDTEDESEKDQTPSDSSNSDNDKDLPDEPSTRLGNLTAQLSFRKIAKKRRKAGGRSSFHHTKSSKEYLRKAQEAYQRLKISEQQQQNDQYHKSELENGRNSIKKSKNSCKHLDRGTSSRASMMTRKSELTDNRYGHPSESISKDVVDFGYGDPAVSEPQNRVDYGYGDPAVDQPLISRRGGRARRRNSVTKFSVEAANVVAAQAAAERILQLKPSITSLSRKYSNIPARRRQLEDEPRRLNTKQNRDCTNGRNRRIDAMRTTLQGKNQEESESQSDDIAGSIVVEHSEPPQRPSRHPRAVCGDRRSVIHPSRAIESAESKYGKHNNSTSQHSISSAKNSHFQLTSDYFSSDPKPNNQLRRNSGRSSGTTFRFNTPARTSSWLSHDNSYSTVNNDDDDADSLASDMESLCSIRDGNYRLDTHHGNHAVKNTDMPPVLPSPPSASPLIIASPLPDRRTRFTSGSSTSGDLSLRKSLAVSWSNDSNKEGSLSRFTKSHSCRERQKGSNDFPILPCVRVVTTNATSSKSCMPAPVNRTPSYKGSQQRQD